MLDRKPTLLVSALLGQKKTPVCASTLLCIQDMLWLFIRICEITTVSCVVMLVVELSLLLRLKSTEATGSRLYFPLVWQRFLTLFDEERLPCCRENPR